MNPTAQPKPTRLAVDVARPVKLSEPAQKLLNPTLTPRQYFDLLAAAPLTDDAVRFLAAALPKREAVGWGVVCLKELLPKPLPPADAKALASAETWVKDPSEGNRRAAGAAAEVAGYGTPAGSLAAAAFWSGGSIAPANLDPVPPRDDLTGIAVAGALILAAAVAPVGTDPAKMRCVSLGAEVASGRVKVV